MLLRTGSTRSIALIILLLPTTINMIDSSKCSRKPESFTVPSTPANGHFHVRIIKDTDNYVPGKTYTIKLEGIDVGHRSETPVKYKFRGFMLGVEMKDNETLTDTSVIGTFTQSPGDTLTRIACPHMVTHTNDSPKSEITVEWTAPHTGCVIFKATVIETPDVWYMEGGPLTKEFCKQEKFEDQFSGPIICKACTEAKYELIFEGLWSRNTHPKDFPNNTFIQKFSDIIGASHTSSFSFWRYGRVASEGLKELAEFGFTTKLEAELMEEISEIRTIIKAKGLDDLNVNRQTFAVFRVDQTHSQISFVSSISPSPDWFVGVSGLELCTERGGWIESKIIDVDLFDAGTDSGRTYDSSNEPTSPPQAVQQIRSDKPADDQSPFYTKDSTTMKPLARIYVSRQRLYDKDCPAGSDVESDMGTGDICAVGEWEYSECSAECGPGTRVVKRQYLNQDLAESAGCDAELAKFESCRGSCGGRDDGSREDGGRGDDGVEETTQSTCTFTEWTIWGPCSKKCGKGYQIQTRQYVDGNGRRCEIDRQHLVKRRNCCTTPCSGDVHGLQNGGECEGQDSIETDGNCIVTKWSTFDQCTVTCGGGVETRTALEFSGDCEDSDKIERRECNKQYCEVEEYCKEPPRRGSHCGSDTPITIMWYYNWEEKRCEQFGWKCSKHGNKFATFEECLGTCSERNPYTPILESNKGWNQSGR